MEFNQTLKFLVIVSFHHINHVQRKLLEVSNSFDGHYESAILICGLMFDHHWHLQTCTKYVTTVTARGYTITIFKIALVLVHCSTLFAKWNLES